MKTILYEGSRLVPDAVNLQDCYHLINQGQVLTMTVVGTVYNTLKTHQRWQDGEEDGGCGGVAGHLRYRGDNDAGDADRGQDWQFT